MCLTKESPQKGFSNKKVVYDCILEGDGTPVDIKGYSRCRARTALTAVGYILTVGILRLVFHWAPQLLMKCTHKPSSLLDATKVLIRDSSGVSYTIEVIRPEKDFSPSLSGLQNSELRKDTTNAAYFIYKRLKYIWSFDSSRFELLQPWEKKPYSELFPVKPLPEETVYLYRNLYGPNVIDIRVTPILNMLVSECLNPFYCFQAFSCALWFSDDYWMYASCIILISSISLVVQVYEMRKNQRALKKTICSSTVVTVCREVNGLSEFVDVDSSELVPGDILDIPRNGCVMHCDALLLSGNCIVNESTLTGESVPVTKTPLPQRPATDEVLIISNVARHVLFGGTKVIQTRNYADERVLAVVARTGFRTAKGELVRSILFPKPIEFKFTRDALKFVAALAVLAVVGFGVSVYLMNRSGLDIRSICLRALDLITVAVPPALPMAMTVGVVFAQRRLRTQEIHCIHPSVINVCGVINVVCFDKTGTLTEDGLNLWGVVPNSDGRFADPHFEPSELPRGPLLESMATCHSLTLIENVLSGDPLDLKMFQSTKWEFIEDTEDHCKFEMTVPAVVRPCAKNCMSDTSLDAKCDTEKLPYEVGILRQFPFTSSLQRMSVIARVLDGSHFNLYTKGAPETIESLCRCDTIPSDFHSLLLEYTREGYRVLAIAWRPLKISYTRMLKIQRERVEQDLLFLGLLVMENRLKPESAPIIRVLRNANIRPVMVTGDNMLTAVSVARDCEMIDELDRIVIVSAKPPPASSLMMTNPANLTLATPTGDLSNGVEVAFATNHFASAPEKYGLPEQQGEPLVEFHYAEDLHKPVTEVTATDGASARQWKAQHRRDTVGVGSILRKNQPRNLGWFRRHPHHPTITTDYRTISDTGNVCVTNEVSSVSAANLSDPTAEPFDFGSVSFTSHRINIRMVDRPDFHLAISGKTWGIIKENYPWLIPKLAVKGTVFARFSPDQKTQLVEALQSVGYFVAMCGDGANDCGALKAAHAGVSLSEAEASVASPFTSKQQNISCIPTLIQEGRCALVTSFGTLKFITSYSLIQFISVIALYYIGSSLSDGQFLYVDLFLITTLSVTYQDFHRDAFVHRDLVRGNGASVAVRYCELSCHTRPGRYLPLYEYSEDYELQNYESTALFIVATYQYLISVMVFSKGAPYRRSMVSNYFLVINFVAAIVCTMCITASNFSLRTSFFLLVDIPSARYLLLLHLIVLANFLICYLIESLVEGVSFHQQLDHIRRALFPRYVQRKDYERIREEIDQLAGSWPPLIRSASVQALPKELFQDTDAVPPVAKSSTRQRKRNFSIMSTETEDEDLPLEHGTETVTIHAPLSTAQHQRSEPAERIHESADQNGEHVRSSRSSATHRSHLFDAGQIRFTEKLNQSTILNAPHETPYRVTSPYATSEFLDMPKSMFHVQNSTDLPLSVPIQDGRRRCLNSGLQSYPS
ncbi:Cation-transporting ATPase [Fasciola hepatica]|uniref:Cation-transporting ATPase n=1 Tax=Fasciola hepatica TaxID=6192 RepID=A0A4E0RHQ7_FASHE|nr:Cation-transporting ATPase [Fasciola hepatica]